VSKTAPPIGKTARNERRKLQAASLNALGLAFAAFGVVQPLTKGELSAEAVARMVICAAIAYVFHTAAMRQLSRLED
jgi:hypothetical protein